MPDQRRTRRQLFPTIAIAAVFGIVLSLLVPIGASSAQTGEPLDRDEFITAAYQGLLGREPESGGQQYWSDRFDEGVAPRVIVESFATSVEHRRHVVRRAYERFLDRQPDVGGLAWWTDVLGRTQAATGLWARLLGSPEYFSTSGGGTNGGYVDAVYSDVLGRNPEPSGHAHWVGRLDGGMSRTGVARAVIASPEAFRLSGLSVVSASPAPAQTVDELGPVELDLGAEVIVEASTIMVWVDGRRVGGTIEGDGDSLRFVPGESPAWVRPGADADVVVTALGYDGTEMARADYTFTLRRSFSGGAGGELFPGHLLVAFYGAAGSPILGVLGEGTPEQAAARLLDQIAPYESLTDREVVPVFELIATLATDAPGPEGHYSVASPAAEIQRYLDTARSIGGMLMLDIQPGRARFIDEARRYEQFLVAPDVGLALDPEWKVGPTGRPGGGYIGTVDAAQINEVSAYLAELVATHDLPEKLLVIHRFTPGMVTNADQVVDRPGVAIVFHADGFGTPEAKIGDYNTLLPDRFARGMKLFYDEDIGMMSPADVMALHPEPGVITYQ